MSIANFDIGGCPWGGVLHFRSGGDLRAPTALGDSFRRALRSGAAGRSATAPVSLRGRDAEKLQRRLIIGDALLQVGCLLRLAHLFALGGVGLGFAEAGV